MKTEFSSITNYRLQGPWLALARVVWVILALVTVVVLALALTGLYTGFHQPCNALPQQEQDGCFAQEQALQHFGLARDFYAIYFPIGVTVEVLPWILAGVLIFWKKSAEPFGLLFSLMLVVAGTFNLDTGVIDNALFLAPTIPTPLIRLMGFIGAALLILWYRFPDGRFIPRGMRWIAVGWIAIQVGNNFFRDTLLNLYNLPSPWSDGINILFAATIVYSLVYRYRHTSDLVQRQQIKWVVLSASVFAIIYILGNLLGLLATRGLFNWDDNFDVLYRLTYSPLSYLSIMFVGVSLGFSILRYRLWDIDFIINRSLVYGALTGLLLVFCGVSMLVVSQFLQNTAGGPLTAALISAVLFGLIFQPARRNLQRFVDRRFYNIQIDYQNSPATLPPTSAQATFGSYRNLELLGRGGMGEVYKARNTATGQIVAIKLLPAALAADAEFRQRFEREAKIAAALSHPNIVRVFESG